MKKRYFTIGIALALLLAGGLGRAEAWQRHFVSNYAGTGVNGVIDTNSDGRTASVVTGIANTTLGRFLFQSEVEFLPVTRVTCPAGTAEFSLVQTHAVLTHERTGDQLFLTYTSGTQCFDPTTLTATAQVQGTFTGGTGRFVNATGSFEDSGTGAVLVFDLPAFHTLNNVTGTVTGTLTGVGDGRD